MQKIILEIAGMTCSACSNGLEKYLKKQNGIEDIFVNLVLANATIVYDEEKVNLEQIEKYIQAAGFKSLGEFKEIKIENSNYKEKINLMIMTILTLILMYISMGHMIHLPIIHFFNPHLNPVNYVSSLFLITICFLIYGFGILKNGYKNLIHKTPNMDTLVSIGVIASLLYSLYNTYLILIGHKELVMNLYFESSAMVIYFVKLGRYIDYQSKNKTKEALQKLVSITPSMANLKVGEGIKKITIDEIKVGNILVARSGERIAVDGEIIAGNAYLDESFITGESLPVEKHVGDKVVAGSINYDGLLEYRAEKIGKDSTISEIVKLVIDATNTKAPLASIADKVSGYFVPSIMIIALLTFIVYVLIGFSFKEAFTSFITILVVACPCSLGLATPLAIIVSEGLCASQGILIKSSEVLENAGKIDTIVFDKTGTLTYGKLKISQIFNFSNLKDFDLIQIAASMEKEATHPIATAFKTFIEENKMKLLNVKNFKNYSGLGIQGLVDNNEILLGNKKFLEKRKIKNQYLEKEKLLAQNGNSIVYMVKNKEIVALFGISDIPIKEASEVISQLIKIKIEPIILTGDNEETAKRIGEKVGIRKVIANVIPKDKADIIKKLKKEKRFVMMCGDGINDSPALALSDIGISVNSGTDIAKNSADVILTNNNLNNIINLIDISKRTVKIIKQNLFLAFFYNILMIPIAAGLLKSIGISINPMLASLSMVLSSITVILNTLRLKRN